VGAIAVMNHFDWAQAAEHFRAALTGRSSSVEAHWAYASLYLQPLGLVKQAVEHMERAVECDPLNALYRGVLASHLTHAGQFERAIVEAQSAIEIDDSNAVPRLTLGETYVALGRWREAVETLRVAFRLTPQAAYIAGMLAGALSRAGERTEADAVVRVMDEQPIHQFGRACYHLIIGEIDAGAQWYERAIEVRDPFVLIFAAAPLTADLRRSPHWTHLAKLLKLAPDVVV